ncbi:MAG: sodium-dependent bicarbonate transport family permease [Bacteroidia bacterium]|nr:sodium-dependent bicarbonate transport family permease [Bacteroidia bacterium]MDW8157481.1 sodium-dependent bicarbonate transport family permease [Bacteroidia bacterium]
MNFQAIIDNISSPPILFFLLGIVATLVKSDLEIPPTIGKFLGIYLLFHIGIVGGEEIYHSRLNSKIIGIIFTCVAISFCTPFLLFWILRLQLSLYNAGAVSAAYGSVNAVTFATAINFLRDLQVDFSGYMVACMALMESPAVISGLILIRYYQKVEEKVEAFASSNFFYSLKSTLHESLFNGSVLIMLGSMLVGLVMGEKGEQLLKPFVIDNFTGFLCLYMLDMGLIAGSKIEEIQKAGIFIFLFALIYPLLFSFLGIGLAYLFSMNQGDAFLFTALISSASSIAVPAAIRNAVPQANIGLLLFMTLGVTFSFNIMLGLPLYYSLIEYLW